MTLEVQNMINMQRAVQQACLEHADNVTWHVTKGPKKAESIVIIFTDPKDNYNTAMLYFPLSSYKGYQDLEMQVIHTLNNLMDVNKED